MKKLLFLLTILLPAFIYAQTFYISPSGNDAANGSVATPWKTLSKAINTARTAGNIIHVNAGTYTESTQLDLAVGVSIEGDGAGNTIIKSTTSGQWSSFLQLQSNQNTNGNQSISGITLDGGYVSESSYKTWIAIWVTGRSNVKVFNCKFIGYYASANVFDGFDATSPLSDPGVTAIGNKFYNNTVTNCSGVLAANGYNGTGSVMIGGQTGFVIENNTITNTGRPALKNGWPIKYWDNGYLKGCKILNNTLVKSPYQATYWGEGGDWDFCIELFNIQGLEIAGNTIQGAIDLNYNYKGSYPYSVWIHDNNLNHATPNYNHSESGVILEFRTESALIENNKFNNKFVGVSYNTRTPNNHGDYTYPCGTGGCSAITDNIIRNNLFTNLYSSYGVSGGVIVQSEQGNDPYIRNLQIYNNTFIAKGTQAAPAGLDFTSQGNGDISGVIVKDNIFQGFSYGSITGQKAATQSNVNITNNDYWNCAAPSWTGATITGNFSSNPNFDANSVSTLPIGYKPAGTQPPLPCTYTYSAWGACVNGIQSRTVTSFTPANCVGTPILTQSCTITPPTCTYVYSAWGECINGTQTRTVLSVSPANCVGTPILTQPCTVVPPPVNDTIRCTVILHGSNLARRVTKYIVKRANGLYYDDLGREVKVWAYKTDAPDWFRKELSDGLFYLWF